MKKLLLQTFLVTVLGVGLMVPAFSNEITVYKSATCGCCKEWVNHLQANGFNVKAQDVSDLMSYKSANDVPMKLGSCHTATVDGYVIEGHVPANDIKRLLKERPPVSGLAVPGMPVGSPSMEQRLSFNSRLSDMSNNHFAGHMTATLMLGVNK